MTRLIYIFLFVFFFNIGGSAQNYIDLRKDQIIQKMRVEHTGYFFDKEVKNGNKSFIKYVDGAIVPETILFVLNKNGTCRFVKHMYEDQTRYPEIQSELNKKYKSIGMNKWLMKQNGKEYEISLEKGDWFFVVNTRKKR